MSITFTCPACSRRFTLDDRLAGKRGQCKSCGAAIRVPTLNEPPDLYGLDDLSPPASEKPTAFGDDDGPGLGQARSGNRRRKGSGRKASAGSPWGVELRRTACACLFFGLFLSRALRTLPVGVRSNPFVLPVSYGTLALMALGAVLTVVTVVGATLSLISGNNRAFGSDTSADRWGWISVLVFTPIFLGSVGYRLTHPLAAAQGPRPAGGLAPKLAGALAPAANALGGEVRGDIHVTLSNGRLMGNTGPIGTARPGVEISIDYQIDGGELAGMEQLVLVIHSAKGRGELNNLHRLRFQRSGKISASSFMARPEDGPYNAWVEVAPMPGLPGEHKQVSNSVSLQFTDVPVVDPAAKARAALEEQSRQMRNPPFQPGLDNALPQPRPIGPVGPRGPMGPRGPIGPRIPRFGPGP
jgi:hypothetical protein